MSSFKDFSHPCPICGKSVPEYTINKKRKVQDKKTGKFTIQHFKGVQECCGLVCEGILEEQRSITLNMIPDDDANNPKNIQRKEREANDRIMTRLAEIHPY